MRRTPITLGILSIVFGSVVALMTAFNLLVQLNSSLIFGQLGALMKNVPQRPGQPDPAQLMAQSAEVMRQMAPYTVALMAGKLLLSVALLGIGIGLYRRRRWGRSSALVWSVLALLYAGIEVIVSISVIMPR